MGRALGRAQILEKTLWNALLTDVVPYKPILQTLSCYISLFIYLIFCFQPFRFLIYKKILILRINKNHLSNLNYFCVISYMKQKSYCSSNDFFQKVQSCILLYFSGVSLRLTPLKLSSSKIYCLKLHSSEIYTLWYFKATIPMFSLVKQCYIFSRFFAILKQFPTINHSFINYFQYLLIFILSSLVVNLSNNSSEFLVSSLMFRYYSSIVSYFQDINQYYCEQILFVSYAGLIILLDHYFIRFSIKWALEISL